MTGRVSRILVAAFLAVLLIPAALTAHASRLTVHVPRDITTRSAGRELTPVVLFPAFHFTKLKVTVRDQTTVPGCPRSGSFQDWFANPQPSTSFSQVCRDELMTLRYDANPRMPMPERFSEQPGVSVRIVGIGVPW